MTKKSLATLRLVSFTLCYSFSLLSLPCSVWCFHLSVLPCPALPHEFLLCFYYLTFISAFKKKLSTSLCPHYFSSSLSPYPALPHESVLRLCGLRLSLPFVHFLNFSIPLLSYYFALALLTHCLTHHASLSLSHRLLSYLSNSQTGIEAWWDTGIYSVTIASLSLIATVAKPCGHSVGIFTTQLFPYEFLFSASS